VRDSRVVSELDTNDRKLRVFLTFDVEIWCNGWKHLDAKFPAAFARYIYGQSSRGRFALPMTLQLLREYGIRSTFFVESLFASRFGLGPLAEIVALIQRAGQDVQLHLHPEWTDEARPPVLEGTRAKRPHLSEYSAEDQIALLSRAKSLLQSAGAAPVSAFRAGGYGCNRATLQALLHNGLRFDSSINSSTAWSGSDLTAAERGQRVKVLEGVFEFPITVFQDRPGHLRHVQVGATSTSEMFHLLRQAYMQDRSAFVIVSHNFEMLVPGSNNPDPIVVRRFRALCQFLADNRRQFVTATFDDVTPDSDLLEPPTLSSSLWRTGLRTFEQARRRLYR
jgi:hypothetical protein